MKPLAIFAAILATIASAIPVAGAAPDGDEATQKLMHAAFFAFGPVSRGGNISDGEQDFQAVMHGPHALENFRRVLRDGTDPAKLYALAGIRVLAPAEFETAATSAAKTAHEMVPTIQGCLAGSRKFSAVVAAMRAGDFDESLKR